MKQAVLFILAIAVALPASATLYRWTDAQGHVSYSDQPPPPNAKVEKMQQINSPDLDSGQSAAPSGPPIVLFTGNCGATCTQAVDFLHQRGIPFTLKNAATDPKAARELEKRTGSMGVPVLFIGDAMQRGYSPSVWDKMLEVAGYPSPKASKPKEGEQNGSPPESSPSEPAPSE